MTHAHCSLCGASDTTASLLAGTSSYVCFTCLGAALASAATSHGKPRGIHDVDHVHLDGSKRCCLCDERAVSTKLVAMFDKWAICGNCLKNAAEICIDDGQEDLGIVSFRPVESFQRLP